MKKRYGLECPNMAMTIAEIMGKIEHIAVNIEEMSSTNEIAERASRRHASIRRFGSDIETSVIYGSMPLNRGSPRNEARAAFSGETPLRARRRAPLRRRLYAQPASEAETSSAFWNVPPEARTTAIRPI